MKYIKTFIKKFIRVDLPKPLGRWRTEECSKQMNNKIDLSNEDHCGPCGQYALKKIESTHSKNTDSIPEKSK
jgi:hypothetical protein